MTRARVLVVEDEVVTALALQQALERMGHDVVCIADTGEGAIRAARNAHLDLVLMDIRLRGAVDGVQAAEKIRHDSSVPVIYLTAYSDQETLSRAKVTEPYGYVVKPFEEKELRANIEIALHNSRLERERRDAQEAVREWERLLQDIVDGSLAIIYIVDLEGRFTLVNRQFTNIFHVSRGEARGKLEREILPAATHVTLSEHDRAVIESGRPAQMEQEVRHDDGPHTYLAIRFPLFRPNGVLYGVCGVLTDITDRKRAEEAIHRLNAELETRVASRTRELAAANEKLGSLARTLSHDIRGPLRGIDSMAEALQEDHAKALEKEGAALLERIRSECQRLAALTNQMMRFHEASGAGMRLADVDVTAQASAIVAALQQESPGRSARVDIQPGMVARGDPVLLRLVLENLLNNAWKYSARQDQTRIEVGTRPGPGGVPEFFVRDNGVGFEPAQANLLFQPFRRLHSPRDYPGTGLGLSSVRLIVERHGGRVRAESEPGKGATFSFTLWEEAPLAPEAPAA